MNLLAEPRAIDVAPHKTFDTFDQALSYAVTTYNELKKAGRPVYGARTWQDRFTKPRDRRWPAAQLLGISAKAIKDCERMSPGGRWTVMAETSTNSLSLFGDISERKLDGYQFSCWYTKFLPYAYSMMHAENGYAAFGLDFECINSYFKTCMGYSELAMGYNPDLDEADSKLWDHCYTKACDLKPPSLPFDEMYRPAFCYVYRRAPRLFGKSVRRTFSDGTPDWRYSLARQVAELLPKEIV